MTDAVVQALVSQSTEATPAPAEATPAAPATPTPEARIASVSASVETALAAKLAQDRVAFDAERAAFESQRTGLQSESQKLAQERERVAKAMQFEELVKSDPAAALKLLGLDPREIIKRVDEGDRVAPLVKERLTPLEKQLAEQAATIKALQDRQAQTEQQQAQLERARAIHEIESIAKSEPEFAALADHFADGLDEHFLESVAEKVVKVNRFATPRDIVKEATTQLLAEAARLSAKSWFAQLGARAAVPSQTTQAASTATASQPKTITQQAATSTSGPPSAPQTEAELIAHVASEWVRSTRQ